MPKLVIFFIITLFVTLLIFLMLITVQVAVMFEKKQTNRKLDIFIILCLGNIKIRKKVKNRKINNSINKLTNEITEALKSNWINIIFKIYYIFRNTASPKQFTRRIIEVFRKFVVIKNVNAEIIFGTGDAAHTGIVIGRMWWMVGVAIAAIENNFKVSDRKVEIVPNFNKRMLNVNFNCIFESKIVYIIIGSIYLLLRYVLFIVRTKKISGGDIVGGTSN